ALAGAALSVVGCQQDNAQASNARERNSKVYIGALTCDVAGGTGYLVMSSRKLDCVFEPMSGGSQGYEGDIRGFGLELGYTRTMKMLYKVYTVGSNKDVTAVEGHFIGQAGSVTVDRTMGGDWLYGGKDGSAAIVGTTYFNQTSLGYNLEYAIASINLKMKSSPPDVAPAVAPAAAEQVPNAPSLKQPPK
ncbi:MAG: DUF992 domain-containing protein, partial [Acidimicrobiia bacterium]